MRKKLWLEFHLWTVGLLVLLTIANVASALRPFSPSLKALTGDSGTIELVQARAATERTPASIDANESNPLKIDLKLTQIGCEPNLRLRVADGVHQVRIRFEPCAMDKVDTVTKVVNVTNGFEATVFNSAIKAESPSHADGTFLMAAASAPSAPGAAKNKSASSNKAARQPAAVPPQAISTDYITLATGQNEITIQREKRQQILKIERK